RFFDMAEYFSHAPKRRMLSPFTLSLRFYKSASRAIIEDATQKSVHAHRHKMIIPHFGRFEKGFLYQTIQFKEQNYAGLRRHM
ncbi:MAG: hypothetical protein IJB41_05435, partial [Clostridia bacterium]|nr:hypothetical protein [Clostridia bacterium]